MKNSLNKNDYIKKSTLNSSARQLLSIVKKSYDLNIKMTYLTIDNYVDPFLCIEWQNLSELIVKQFLQNESLFNRLNFLLNKSQESSEQNKTYTESYALTTKFKVLSGEVVFASQVECIKLSATQGKFPYRVSEIKTLPAEKEGVGGASYENIKYQCWEYIDNKIIKNILKGELSEELNYDQKISCSQIISMMLCESSRNPTTYITAPMVLDLIDYWLNKGPNLIGTIEKLYDIEFTLDSIKTGDYVKENGIMWNKKAKEYFPSEKEYYKNQEPLAYSFFKVFYLRTELEDIGNIEDKSKITSIFINNLFPMVMKGAVSVSRHINNLINTITKEKYSYDSGTPSTGKQLKEFIDREKTLITLWKECFPDASINALTKEWFAIDLVGDYSLISDDFFSIDEIPFSY